jgi:restriction system protein
MRYYKIHLGKQNMHARLGVEQGFIGIGFNMPNLSHLNLQDENLKESIRKIYLENHPDSSRASVASATGMIYRFIKTMEVGDIVIVPLGDNTYRVGEIIGDYFFAGENEPIQHRKNVKWISTLLKENFSQEFKNTVGAIATISDITHRSAEIEALLSGDAVRVESVQSGVDQSEFALEKHLEDFLIENWSNTDLGREYDLFKNEDGEIQAQQYYTEVGPIDILAIKKDKSEVLIIELKKGRSSDAVVGQMLRYVTAVKREVAEEGQKIRAIILTGQDDKKIRYSLEPLNGLIEFMVYKVSFAIERKM